MTLRYVNSWKYFNAETGKRSRRKRLTATKVHVTWKQMIIHKNLYGGGGDSGAFRDELPVLWITAVVLGSDTFIKDTGTKMSCI